MKKLIAALVVLAVFGGSGGAEAFSLFKKGRRLPKPIDSPIVRGKVRDDHKAGKRGGKHPPDWSAPA